MKSLKTVLGIMALTTLGLVASTGQAQAAASFCVPGPNTDGLAVSDVTFRGNNADDCYGVLGDNFLTVTEVNNLWAGLYGSGDYGYLLYANGSSVNMNGLNFDFDLSGSTSGSWDLEINEVGAAGPFPQTLDILMLLQDDDTNPDKWAFYLFNDETFVNTNDVDGNHWEIGWVNGNSTPRLDTAILMFRNGTPGTGSGSGSGQAAVPEPASLLLLGSGLSAAAMRARRKKQAAQGK
ncbi:MAG: PEP-CTERM sorting domain-containing protein [Vicinamibacterales bacterium]